MPPRFDRARLATNVRGITLVLHNTNIQCPKAQPTVKRQINGTTIAQFKLSLSDENWLDTFSEEDMDSSFNNF